MPSATDYLNYGLPVAGGVLNYRTAKRATKRLTAGANQAMTTLGTTYNEQKQFLDPYRQAGQGSLQQLQTGLQPGGEYNTPFNKDTFDLTKDPSYQWRLEQGQQAIERSAAAKGLLQSGGTLKALTRYGQDAASQEYQNAFNRYQTDTTGRYNREKGLTDTGLTAASAEASAAEGYGANLANLQTELASAEAQGDHDKAAAISGTINSILGTISDERVLKALGVGGAAAGVGGAAGIAAGNAAMMGSAGALAPLGATGALAPPALTAPAMGGGLGGSLSSAAAGAGHGLTSAMSFLATNPIGWGIDAAIVGALVAKKLVGRGRKTANRITGEGGLQHNFENDLEAVDQMNDLDEGKKWQAKQALYKQFKQDIMGFAKKGGQQTKVARQALDSISHLFGEANPLQTLPPNYATMTPDEQVRAHLSGLG